MFLVTEGAVVLHAGGARAPPDAPPGAPAAPPRPAGAGGSAAAGGGDSGELAAGERIVGKGDVFGEAGLFPEELGAHRVESARTLSFVSALVLTAAAMREIREEYPVVRARACVRVFACVRACVCACVQWCTAAHLFARRAAPATDCVIIRN
jgi:CRP-like cAMP-binding protein